jgi:uncharacterized protein with FMN-binding domain
MLKKLFVCAALLMFSLGLVAGCGNGDDNGDDVAAGTYNDGTYTAVSANANARGFVEVTLTIAADEVTDVAIVEFDGFGVPKDYATYGVEGAFDGSDLQEAHETLAAAMVEGNTWDVDTVTDATSTSNKTRSAAQLAMEKALVEPASGNTYFDGTFFAVSDQDQRGNFVIALVTVEDDVIVAVELSEATATEEGISLKDYDDYGQEGVFDGSNLQAAHEALAAAMVENNSADVDVATGATGTSTKAMEAAQRALDIAKR